MVKLLWGFRDIDLVGLMEGFPLKIEETKYFHDRVLGSTTLVKARVVK